MSWKPASRAVLTLFGDPVCVRPTARKVPDILLDAGETMVRRILKEIPNFLEDDDDEEAAARQLASDLAAIGFKLTDGEAIAQRLERAGWSDLSKDEAILDLLDYWEIEIEESERRAQERWVEENGLQPTFGTLARAKRQATVGWAVFRSPHDRRGSVIFVESEEAPSDPHGPLRGLIVPLEEIEVDV